jgi:hypothetical protein
MALTKFFRAKPQTLDGYRFATTAERDRYVELRMLFFAGSIGSLAVQYPVFDIEVLSPIGEMVKVATYTPDFSYIDLSTMQVVIEDVKPGLRTDVYKLKKRMVEAIYGIRIVEVTPRRSRR